MIWRSMWLTRGVAAPDWEVRFSLSHPTLCAVPPNPLHCPTQPSALSHPTLCTVPLNPLHCPIHASVSSHPTLCTVPPKALHCPPNPLHCLTQDSALSHPCLCAISPQPLLSHSTLCPTRAERPDTMTARTRRHFLCDLTLISQTIRLQSREFLTINETAPTS